MKGGELMANPVGVHWTDPPPGPMGPKWDQVHVELYFTPPGGSQLLVGIWTVASSAEQVMWGEIGFAPGEWQVKAWPKKDGKFATVFDDETWEVEGSPPVHTPTDSEIPPIEDLALAYAA